MDANIEKRIREIEESVKTIAMFVKKQSEKTERMEKITQETVKTMAKRGFEDYADKINSAMKNIESIKEQIEEIRMSKPSEIAPDVSSLREKILSIENRLPSFATKDELSNVNKMIPEDFEERIESEINEKLGRLADIENKLNSIDTITGQIKSISNIENRMNTFTTKDDLSQVKNKLNEFATRNDFESLKNSLRKEITSDKVLRELELLKSTDEEQSTIHKSLEKKIQDVEREITALKIAGSAEEKSDIRDIEDNIIELKNLILEEQAKRASFFKNVQELENELSSIRKEKTKTVIGKDVEDKLNKAIVDHLGEFAKVMDKRLPNIVTREEYISFIRDVDKRLQNIETPNISHLLQRIEFLERQIGEINTIAKDVYNRIPVIVE